MSQKHDQKVLETAALDNQALVQGGILPTPTEVCDEPAFFVLQDKHREFSVSLSTVLSCLKFAEEQGVIPTLPDKWWWAVESRYSIKYHMHNQTEPQPPEQD